MLKPSVIWRGLKEYCGLVPKHFRTDMEGLYLHNRSSERMFNIARLRAIFKVHEISLGDLLVADYVAGTSHTVQQLQALMNIFSQALKDIGLMISLK